MQVEVFTTDNNTLVVKNQFRPKKTNNASTGLGLSSISERYQLLLNKKINIVKTSEYFSVELPLISQQENENID